MPVAFTENVVSYAGVLVSLLMIGFMQTPGEALSPYPCLHKFPCRSILPQDHLENKPVFIIVTL